MLRCLFAGFVVTIAAIFHLCSGCSLTGLWTKQTFLERASQADIIVNGVVTNLYPIPEHPTSFPDAYVAEFEILCIFRDPRVKCPEREPYQVGTCVEECSRDNNCSDNMLCCSNGCGHTCQPFETDTDLGKYVNVTYMGMLHSCSATTVDIYYEYIMLLTMNDAGELEPDEINLQTAAFVADEEHWRDLGVLCNIATTPPIGERTCDEKVESRQIQVVDGCYMYSGSVSTYVGRSIVASLLLFVLQSSMVFFN